MKNKYALSFPLLSKVVLLTLFLSLFRESSGQERLNVAVGLGFPEHINTGLRLQMKQAQIGVSIGTIPGKEHDLLALSGDIFAHFAGKSRFSERLPAYFRLGVSYIRDETEFYIDKTTYLTLRAGRDINVSKRLGFFVDGGIIYELANKHTDLIPSGWNIDLDINVAPGLSFGMFYRFL